MEVVDDRGSHELPLLEASYGITNHAVSNNNHNNNNFKPPLLSNRRSTEDMKQIRRMKTTATTISEMESLLEPLQQQQQQPQSPSKSQETTTSPQHVVVLGYDISHLSPSNQFAICAGGTFGFTLIYGFLQELVIVNIAGRKFAVFLAACQFFFFTFWSLLLVLVRRGFTLSNSNSRKDSQQQQQQQQRQSLKASSGATAVSLNATSALLYYQFVGLALIRALDVTVSNLSMKYLNYPARTLIKSSRVVFTMILGIVIQNKRYRFRDYFAVSLLVLGLSIFLHADSTSSAVFNPLGVFLLILSLTCDGVINNLSEKMMKQYGLTQDDYHLRLYSLSFIASVTGAYLENEIWSGIHHFFLVPGTVPEIESGVFDHNPTTWSVSNKIIVFFLLYMTGLFGGSCLGAITKRFGALAMTLTSTTRKAATMFVSFSLFAHNTCTWEHVCGIALYIVSLLLKGFNKAKKNNEDMLKSVAAANRLANSGPNHNNNMLDDVEKASHI